ncbi:hypothetical protein H0X48_00100 [Candidatus Dependentiae bacterium]|nr:hypothetical protein [Candidatus Dependentiae bacterium]
MIFKIIIVLLFVLTLLGVYCMPVFKKLPAPTGRFAVSSTLYHFVDHARKEMHISKKTGQRELMVRAWYPTDTHTDGIIATQKYLNDVVPVMQKQFTQKTSLPGWLLKPFIAVKTHTQLQSSVTTEKKVFPVIIFSHGFRAPIELYTAYIEELASHGYVVFGINHTYATYTTAFPDGRIVYFNQQHTLDTTPASDHELEVWVADIHFVLEKIKELKSTDTVFKDRLDLENCGFMGHSFGGVTALAAAQVESACKAFVNLDGPLSLYKHRKQGSSKPFLFMVQEYARSNNTADTKEKIHKLIEFCHASKAYGRIIEIQGAGHQAFGDFVFLKYPLAKLFGFDVGTRGSYAINACIRKEIVTFFNNHLHTSVSNAHTSNNCCNCIIERL